MERNRLKCAACEAGYGFTDEDIREAMTVDLNPSLDLCAAHRREMTAERDRMEQAVY